VEVDKQKAGENPMNAKKRTSLDAVFGADEISPARANEKRLKRPQPAEAAPQSTAEHEVGQGRASPARKRPGITQQTAYLPDPVYEQLRRLGFEEKRKMHTYLMEGVDRVFADRGLPAIKDLIK
jgi:hypothetical protein